MRRLRYPLVVLGLSLVALTSTCGDDDPCKEPFSCPDAGTINCMPPGGASSELCSGPCHDWIVENCPEVEFVF